MRIHFIDGPAAGRTLEDDRTPRRLHAEGSDYRRVRYFRATTFYRHEA
jgi:hypothetical protein